jgi:hypothetical protein
MWRSTFSAFPDPTEARLMLDITRRSRCGNSRAAQPDRCVEAAKIGFVGCIAS